MTKEGFNALQAAWPTHLASVRRHVFDHLAGIDLDPITNAFKSFAAEECAVDSK